MRVHLKNVGVIKEADVEFCNGVNLILGSSGSGKSTLLRAIYNTITNSFSDYDVSFNKKELEVTIEHDNNIISYIRDLTSKDRKSSYIINGTTYTKLGRASLHEVTSLLKLDDYEINGEKINFNFNSQFSQPFIILGSPSTLYNVLTYRNTFDVSKLNDLHSADLKQLNSDIKLNRSMRESLVSDLENLENQANLLKPVEVLYSDYIRYKNKKDIFNEIACLHDNLNNSYILNNFIDVENSLIKDLNYSLDKESLFSDLYLLTNKYNDYAKYDNFIIYSDYLLEDTSNLLRNYDLYSSCLNLSSWFDELTSLSNKINISNEIIDKINKLLKYNDLYVDLINIKCLYDRYYIYLNELSNVNQLDLHASKFSIIDDLLRLIDHLTLLDKESSEINDINQSISYVKEELSAYKVCPLCGKELDHEV